jgi:Na+/H+ antiporter
VGGGVRFGGGLSPTDPVAATTIASGLGVPRQIVTILEGESLVNDGTALVLYHVAVPAVVAGTFSMLDVGLQFVIYRAGGAAIGLLIGWVISRVRRWMQDPLVETTIALFTSYAAYIPEELGVSGVIAVVAAGIYLGWCSPEMTAPRNRLQVFEIFEVLPFLLNSVLFILVGLQLPNILEGVSGEYSVATALLYAALVSLTVIMTRLVWTFPAAYLPRLLSRRLRERDPYHSWQRVAVVAYTGMRGAVSLAAALAIPLTIEGGAAFPGRDLILFLTYGVILITLVPQGLSLPFIIRRLGLAGEKAWRSVRRPRRGCGQRRPLWRGPRNWRTRIGCARTRLSGCATSTSTAAAGLPPDSTVTPKMARRKTTRSAPWRISV